MFKEAPDSTLGSLRDKPLVQAYEQSLLVGIIGRGSRL